MDHQRFAAVAKGTFQLVRVTEIEGEIILRVRIHHARGHLIKSLWRLTVAIPGFGSEFAGPAAHGKRLQERIPPRAIAFPDLQLTLILEDRIRIGSARVIFRLPISLTRLALIGWFALSATSSAVETHPEMNMESADKVKNLNSFCSTVISSLGSSSGPAALCRELLIAVAAFSVSRVNEICGFFDPGQERKELRDHQPMRPHPSISPGTSQDSGLYPRFISNQVHPPLPQPSDRSQTSTICLPVKPCSRTRNFASPPYTFQRQHWQQHGPFSSEFAMA